MLNWKTDLSKLGYTHPCKAKGYLSSKVFELEDGSVVLKLDEYDAYVPLNTSAKRLDEEITEVKFRPMDQSEKMIYQSASGDDAQIVYAEFIHEDIDELIDLWLKYAGETADRDEMLNSIEVELYDDMSGVGRMTMIYSISEGEDDAEYDTFIELIPGYGSLVIPEGALSKESVLVLFQNKQFESLFRIASLHGGVGM